MKTITSPTFLATLFLYTVALVFTVVVGYQLVFQPQSPPSIIATSYITLIIGYAVNAIGVQHGVSSTNDTVEKVALAQYPLTPEGIAQKDPAPPKE